MLLEETLYAAGLLPLPPSTTFAPAPLPRPLAQHILVLLPVPSSSCPKGASPCALPQTVPNRLCLQLLIPFPEPREELRGGPPRLRLPLPAASWSSPPGGTP